MIPALCVYEPYASAIVHGIKTWETRGQPPNGEMRPDGVRGFPGVRLARGDRIMVIANAKPPSMYADFGDWHPRQQHGEWKVERQLSMKPGDLFGQHETMWLHPGHIVGSVTVTDALPIIPNTDDPPDKSIYHCIDGRLELQEVTGDPWVASNVHHADLSDQLPWGWWEPGRWAWRLADPLTTNEMCPVCEGLGTIPVSGRGSDGYDPCHVCDGDGQCDPIPVRGHQGLRPLKPEQFL